MLISVGNYVRTAGDYSRRFCFMAPLAPRVWPLHRACSRLPSLQLTNRTLNLCPASGKSWLPWRPWRKSSGELPRSWNSAFGRGLRENWHFGIFGNGMTLSERPGCHPAGYTNDWKTRRFCRIGARRCAKREGCRRGARITGWETTIHARLRRDLAAGGQWAELSRSLRRTGRNGTTWSRLSLA